MAYLVLALGAFLSICGGLSILFGYAIVEVERGWTGVIAGATALTGGIITIALGLVLKTLLDLRKTWANAPPRDHRLEAFGPLETAAPTIVPLTASVSRGPIATHDVGAPPPGLMTPELESGMLAAMLSSQEPDHDEPGVAAISAPEPRAPTIDALLERQRAAPSADREPIEASQVELRPMEPPHAEHSQAEHAPAEHAQALDSQALNPQALNSQVLNSQVLPGVVEPSPEPVRARDPSRFKVSFKRSAPAAPAPPIPEPAPPLPVEHEAPAMDDWLDRAFTALDNEAPPSLPRATPLDIPPPTPPLEPAMAHADHAAAEADAPRRELHPEDDHEPHAETGFEPEDRNEPQHDPARTTREPEPAPPSPPPPTSAVIGRYEADGTAYIMYADGSIEAQSDAGIRRFNSMAELKAYIEGG